VPTAPRKAPGRKSVSPYQAEYLLRRKFGRRVREGKTEIHKNDNGTWSVRLGCDIHCILEQRDGVRWIGVNRFEPIPLRAIDMRSPPLDSHANWLYWNIEQRDYRLFERLANVRSDGRGENPDPRGIPDDASELSRMEIDHWGSDGHSHSWGLLSEIGGLFLAVSTPAALLDEERHRIMMELFGLDSDTDPTHYRLVYFFDN
jgi:hypothetical protein